MDETFSKHFTLRLQIWDALPQAPDTILWKETATRSRLGFWPSSPPSLPVRKIPWLRHPSQCGLWSTGAIKLWFYSLPCWKFNLKALNPGEKLKLYWYPKKQIIIILLNCIISTFLLKIILWKWSFPSQQWNHINMN